MKGKIHSFLSLGTLDVPGVRFVVFMHGCNLHCGYCHNIDVCKGEYKEFSAIEVFEKIKNYRDYFGEDGGITVSGGEPLLQSEFVFELFELCKKDGINTALDTSGSIFDENTKKLLSLTDLVLLDLKMTNNEDYKKHIGCEIYKPLEVLEFAEENKKKVWIRHVVVEGLNDKKKSISRLKEICSEYSCIEKIELLPFKKLCKTKYDSMGLVFPFDKYNETPQKTIDDLYKIINED